MKKKSREEGKSGEERGGVLSLFWASNTNYIIKKGSIYNCLSNILFIILYKMLDITNKILDFY